MIRETLAMTLALASCATVHAASFTYRGHLEDGGAPAQGPYDLRLTLYADRDGQQPLTAPIELNEVAVAKGGFAVGVSFADVPPQAHFGWLEVAVKSEHDGDYWPLPEKQPVALKAQICPESWSLTGNVDSNPLTDFLGTTDNSALEFRVNNSRALRIEPDAISPNSIGGHPNNSVLSGWGVTIAGGGGASSPNLAFGNNTTISGGAGNAVRTFNSTVPGGALNCAGGALSFAAGYRAKVRPGAVVGSGACAGAGATGRVLGDSGTFVWADHTEQDSISTGSNQFLVRAGGGVGVGVGVGTNAPQSQLHVYSDSAAPGSAFEFSPTVLVENDFDGDFFSQAIYARVSGGIGNGLIAIASHPSGSTVGGNAEVSSPLGRAVQATSPADGHAGYFSGGRVYSQGNVGIGVVNPSCQLHLSQDLAAKPTSNTWTVSSDERLKTDIKTLDGSLDKLLALRGVGYRWRDPDSMGGHDGTYAGLLAQTVELVFPEWVGTDTKGFRTVTVIGFEGLVAEALRELRAEKHAEMTAWRATTEQEIARLADRNAVLDAEGIDLRARLAKLGRAQADEQAALRVELALLREMRAPTLAKGAP